MLTLKINYQELAFVAATRNETILRVLFDDYVYKHISKEEFEIGSKHRNYCPVRVFDHGKDSIDVKIKTKGVGKKINETKKISQFR